MDNLLKQYFKKNKGNFGILDIVSNKYFDNFIEHLFDKLKEK